MEDVPLKRDKSLTRSLIGATAAHHGLTIVTRHSKDFKNLGLDVLNPWND